MGSVLSTSLLGVVFATGVTSAAMRSLAAALVVISALLLVSVLPGLVGNPCGAGGKTDQE